MKKTYNGIDALECFLSCASYRYKKKVKNYRKPDRIVAYFKTETREVKREGEREKIMNKQKKNEPKSVAAGKRVA